MTRFESRQVAWWPVHEFIEAAVARANYDGLPIAGTPGWRALSDGDPRKLLAVAVAGEHHVLRIETAQTALADASGAIAASTNWARVANEIRGRRSADRIERAGVTR